jgi:methylmalonyl-CoA epimerase
MGCEAGVEETIEAERVRVLMLGTGGESHVELIEALDGDSTVRRFVERRGEGLHHIALGVEDVEASLAVARERGLRLVRNELGIGAGGRRYFFIHPESAGGVLLEICERGATQTRGEGKELPCG